MKADILVFAAHPDDAEISAAGTIMKHVEMGKKVVIVDLTGGELGSRGSKELRLEEATAASALMGVADRVNLGMADGFFEISKENTMAVIEQVRKYQPEIVLTTAVSDRHIDHGRASKLTAEACFLSGLRRIESSLEGIQQQAWRPKSVYHYIQDYYHHPDFVVDISDYVDRKIEVLKCYGSQFHDPDSKEPLTPISGENFFHFLKGRWAQYGRLINVDYAEGFTVDRAIGVEDLTSLK